MGLTIKKIKDFCIELDVSNVEAGDKSIGIHKEGVFIPFRDRHDVELFYASVGLKELLQTYANYNGLRDYRTENPTDYQNSYSIDILSIIELL